MLEPGLDFYADRMSGYRCSVRIPTQVRGYAGHPGNPGVAARLHILLLHRAGFADGPCPGVAALGGTGEEGDPDIQQMVARGRCEADSGIMDP